MLGSSKVDHIFDRRYIQIQQPFEERALVHRDAPLKPRVVLAVLAGAFLHPRPGAPEVVDGEAVAAREVLQTLHLRVGKAPVHAQQRVRLVARAEAGLGVAASATAAGGHHHRGVGVVVVAHVRLGRRLVATMDVPPRTRRGPGRVPVERLVVVWLRGRAKHGRVALAHRRRHTPRGRRE